MQRSNQILVEKSPLNKKKTVCKKTICKKTTSTPMVNRFAIIGVSNNIGDINNSSMTIHGCGRDYVQRKRELTPGASSRDEEVGDEKVGDEAVGDVEVGDEEIGDDDSIDSEWGKDGIEVRDDDSTDIEKDLKGDDNMGEVADSDGKLSNCKSDDLPYEIDCWVNRNIDQTTRVKMRVGLIFEDVHAFCSALKD
ncbi:hypothetical protein NE237_026499 [Protea cynaroides]|uniref:Uncharacterized protein n=1 Tax=Protea cynaroides TaxID=273540 RepID=A0A9Q0K2S6_9MAGN|nr:hypothetical protein NE237_026499 [Protea cynaroides]